MSTTTSGSTLFQGRTVGNRLYLQIADSLAQLIMTDNLSPGDRLPPERELAQVYEVSRQTVREALIALEVLNLVMIKPGSGVYVQPDTTFIPDLSLSSKPGYLEIIEGLSHFAGEATFLGTQRMSNEELLTLKVYSKKIREMVEQGDVLTHDSIAEIARFEKKFHELLAVSSRNIIIRSTVQWLWQLHEQSSGKQSQTVQAAHTDPDQVDQSTNHKLADTQYAKRLANYYEEIYRFMSRRDAESARKMMQDYVGFLSELHANL